MIGQGLKRGRIGGQYCMEVSHWLPPSSAVAVSVSHNCKTANTRAKGAGRLSHSTAAADASA